MDVFRVTEDISRDEEYFSDVEFEADVTTIGSKEFAPKLDSVNLIDYSGSNPDTIREPGHLRIHLDEALRERNSYYNDLREGNILKIAQVKKVELNASREYMKSVGRLGGQNKFPRLSNDRKIAEQLYAFILE